MGIYNSKIRVGLVGIFLRLAVYQDGSYDILYEPPRVIKASWMEYEKAGDVLVNSRDQHVFGLYSKVAGSTPDGVRIEAGKKYDGKYGFGVQESAKRIMDLADKHWLKALRNVKPPVFLSDGMKEGILLSLLLTLERMGVRIFSNEQNVRPMVALERLIDLPQSYHQICISGKSTEVFDWRKLLLGGGRDCDFGPCGHLRRINDMILEVSRRDFRDVLNEIAKAKKISNREALKFSEDTSKSIDDIFIKRHIFSLSKKAMIYSIKFYSYSNTLYGPSGLIAEIPGLKAEINLVLPKDDLTVVERGSSKGKGTKVVEYRYPTAEISLLNGMVSIEAESLLEVTLSWKVKQ